MTVLPNRKKSGHVLITADHLRWLEVWTGRPAPEDTPRVFVSVEAFPCSTILKGATKSELSAGSFKPWNSVHSAFTIEEVDAVIALLEDAKKKLGVQNLNSSA